MSEVQCDYTLSEIKDCHLLTTEDLIAMGMDPDSYPGYRLYGENGLLMAIANRLQQLTQTPATDGLVLPPLPEGRGLFYRMITNQFDCNGGDWFICMIGQSSPEGVNRVPYSGEGDTIRAAALDALSKVEQLGKGK